jgi:hypothetical protein
MYGVNISFIFSYFIDKRPPNPNLVLCQQTVKEREKNELLW